MHDPRAALLQHNSGHWKGCFIRLGSSGNEDDRFPTSLKVQERDGVIENCLTYLSSGEQRSMNFETVPFTMQVNSSGGWSLGPSAITPLAWVGELSVVHGEERRRVVARHGFHGLDQWSTSLKPGKTVNQWHRLSHCSARQGPAATG